MNKGGIILTDNVLWSGKVVETLHPKDSSTKIFWNLIKWLKR